MRHTTVCRQDAGSTFGVTFRPPLNTCGSLLPLTAALEYRPALRLRPGRKT